MRLDELRMIAHEFEPIENVTQSFSEVSEGIQFRLSYSKDGKKYFVVMQVMDGRDKYENVRAEVEMCFELMRDGIAQGRPCA